MDAWLNAVSTYNLESVLAQYARDAIVLPTVVSRVLQTPDERHAYFKTFLHTLESEGSVPSLIWHTRVNPDVHVGLYRFGRILARFTFVMRDGLIVHHHSSSVA